MTLKVTNSHLDPPPILIGKECRYVGLLNLLVCQIKWFANQIHRLDKLIYWVMLLTCNKLSSPQKITEQHLILHERLHNWFKYLVKLKYF